MKQPHTTTVFFILIFLNTTVFWAQKHPASVLDMRTANGGILSPQLTTTQRDALATDKDSKGLLIYNTDTNKFNFHDGTSWIVLSAGGSSTLLDADGDTKVQVEESGDEDLIRFDTAVDGRLDFNFKHVGMANTSGSVERADNIPAKKKVLAQCIRTEGLLIGSNDGIPIHTVRRTHPLVSGIIGRNNISIDIGRNRGN
jgi:hypothetical protein